MSLYSFFITVHLDRFSDLSMVIGNVPVTITPWSMSDGNRVEVYIRGESSITRRLDQCLQRIKHILESAPVWEWS